MSSAIRIERVSKSFDAGAPVLRDLRNYLKNPLRLYDFCADGV